MLQGTHLADLLNGVQHLIHRRVPGLHGVGQGAVGAKHRRNGEGEVIDRDPAQDRHAVILSERRHPPTSEVFEHSFVLEPLIPDTNQADDYILIVLRAGRTEESVLDFINVRTKSERCRDYQYWKASFILGPILQEGVVESIRCAGF